ncbi:MAG: hypothetical protein ACYTFG_08715 [Planctomycetota bacterium]|jgi:hypothetical protein
MRARLLLFVLLLAMVTPSGALGELADEPVTAGAKFRITSLLNAPPLLSIRSDDDEAYLEDEDEDDEGGMDVLRKKEYEQGLYELRVACYIWMATLDAIAESSNRGMRMAEAFQYLSLFNTSIQHIDFVEELGMEKNQLIINPEVTLRISSSAFRLSWWRLVEKKSVTPSKVYAFGDIIYALDQGVQPVDEDSSTERIPPDLPATRGIPEIEFLAEIQDLKLIYEYRIQASKSMETYVGLAIHWLRYVAQGNTKERVYTPHEDDGFIYNRKRVDDDQLGDYPFVSISLRMEYRPADNYYLSLDLQEMYFYGGNYTDLKVGGWSQIIPYVRIGAGWRLWNAQAELYNLGGNEYNLDVNLTLMGVWIGVFAII